MTHKEHFGKLPDHEVQTGLRYSKLTRTPNQSLPSCKINLQLLAETITTKSIVHTIQRFQHFWKREEPSTRVNYKPVLTRWQRAEGLITPATSSTIRRHHWP